MSRQQLADKAKLSLSTLEKVLGGRRLLTLATAVRVEEALGVSLRRSTPDADAPVKDGVAPDGLGANSRRGVAWLEGVYVTPALLWRQRRDLRLSHRNSLGRGDLAPGVSRGGTRGRRVLAIRRSRGAEPVGSRLSLTNRHGQHRLITVSRPTITGEMYGVVATLFAGRGALLTPIAAPIALSPVKNAPQAAYGRIAAGDARGAIYRDHLQRVTSEQFAMFLP